MPDVYVHTKSIYVWIALDFRMIQYVFIVHFVSVAVVCYESITR